MNDAPPRGVMGALGTKRRVALAMATAIIGALAVLVATGTSPGEGFAPGLSVEAALAGDD